MITGLRTISAAAVVLAALSTTMRRGDAAVVTFEAVARTGDAIPDSGGATFDRLNSPAREGDTLTFLGRNATGSVTGAYTSSGGTLTRVVDTSTPIPGGTGNYTGFGALSISGGTLAFDGNGSDFQSGVYTIPVTGGSPTRVVDTSTPIPGGSGNFDNTFSSNLNGGTIGFEGQGSGLQEGIYVTSGGTVTRVADRTTTMPGTANQFAAFGSPAVASDGTAIFHGSAGAGTTAFQGIYAGNGGSLTTIVNSDTAMPGMADTFQRISSPSVSADGAIAFQGQGETTDPDTGAPVGGIYKSEEGVLSVVADTNTPTPNGTGDFALFLAPLTSISGDSVAFMAFDLTGPTTLREGLYVSRNGEIIPILFDGQTFDGRTVDLFFFSRSALEGDSLAFATAFTDGSWGIYTATISPAAVPEPSSLMLLGLLGGVAAVANRRRRRSDQVAAVGKP